MKVAIAQINTTVGDFTGNAERILQASSSARDKGADLVVFPEMALCGFPPGGLLDRPAFIKRNCECLHALARQIHGIGAVVGHAGAERDGSRLALLDSVSLLCDREIVATRSKTTLSDSDVLQEKRFFKAASENHPVMLGGNVLGLTVGEDMAQSAAPAHEPELTDVAAELVSSGAHLLVNCAATAYHRARPEQRLKTLQATASAHSCPLVSVNLVGGNGADIFDGSSVALSAKGQLVLRCRSFQDDLQVVDLSSGVAGDTNEAETDAGQVLEALQLGLRDYALKSGFKKALLGLSGGIDSALVAVIAVRALGPDNVLAAFLPSRFTSKQSMEDSRALADNLGIRSISLSVEPMFEAFLSATREAFDGLAPDTTEENAQARVRGLLLMALSNKLGHVLLNTGNKSEAAMGYCTLYGDTCGALAVIGDLTKTQVYEAARRVNRDREIIPSPCLTKAPTAELRANQTDQDSLPPYNELDKVLTAHVERGLDRDELLKQGLPEGTVERVLAGMARTQYKRLQAPPALKISRRPFGACCAMPLVHRWSDRPD